MNLFKVAAIACFSVSLLAGCSHAPDPAADQAVALNVLYPDKGEFEQDFENMIQAKFPNAGIRVTEYRQAFVPGKDRAESFIAFMKEQQPDLVMIPTDIPGLFGEMAQQGLLAPLDSRIEQDRFDLDGLLPGPVAQLRSAGAGSLFALPMTFTAEALYYNKDLFDRYKLPYPSDGMTFMDVLKLAGRFAGHKDLYGYSRVWQDTGDLVLYAGNSENLKWVDAAGDKIVFDTDGWRGIVERMTDILTSGAIYNTAEHTDPSAQQNSLSLDPFLKGTSAMTIAGPAYTFDLRNASFRWALAGEPINSFSPSLSNSLQPAKVIGIASGSDQADMAWNVLAFINGEQVAQLRAKVADDYPADFPERTSLIDNEAWKPFYRLEANPAKWTKQGSRIEFFKPIMEDIIAKEMSAMSAGTQSLDQTLQHIDAAANAEWSKNESWGE